MNIKFCTFVMFLVTHFVFSFSAKANVIHFEQKVFDLGDVFKGELATLKVKFQNISDQLLKITNHQADCGCLVSDLNPDQVYQPLEKGELTVKLKTENLDGAVIKNIVFWAENNEKPAVLSIKVNIIPELSIDKNILMVQNDQKFIEFKVHKNSKAKLLNIDYNQDVFLLKTSQHKDSYTVQVKMKNIDHSKLKNEVLILNTTSKFRKKIRVSVVFKKIKPYLSDKHLEFGQLKNKFISKSFFIKKASKNDSYDLSVSLHVNNKKIGKQQLKEMFHIQRVRSVNGVQFRVRLKKAKGVESGAVDGVIHLVNKEKKHKLHVLAML